jgi:hypothetical protein
MLHGSGQMKREYLKTLEFRDWKINFQIEIEIFSICSRISRFMHTYRILHQQFFIFLCSLMLSMNEYESSYVFVWSLNIFMNISILR